MLLLAIGVAVALTCSPLPAQPGSGRRHANRCAAASPDPLRQLATRLSRRWNRSVVVDPALPRTSLAETPADDLPIEAALDLALESRRGVAWRRVQAPLAQAELPAAEVLAAAARVLEQREMGSLLIEDPTAKRITVCLKDQAPSSARTDAAEKRDGDSALIFLVYSTTTRDGELPAQRFAELQRQQLALPVPPEQRAVAMLQMMRLLQALPPADMERFASRTLEAGMPLWEGTPPEQRREMIQETLQMMKAFDAGLQRAAAPGAIARSPLPVQHKPQGSDPKALAAALAKRCHATVVVDPALRGQRLPELPAPDAPTEESFAAVVRAMPGSAWRRIYLTAAQLKRLPAAEKLAAWVRALEELEPGSLTLEAGATGSGTTLRKGEPLVSRSRLLQQSGLSEQPVYLLFSTTPSARGETPEERLADLQRQQIGLMLRMGSEQMGQSMGQVIRSFSSADPETRARLLALPAMAGLMAVWMPREAKEGGEPLVP